MGNSGSATISLRAETESPNEYDYDYDLGEDDESSTSSSDISDHTEDPGADRMTIPPEWLYKCHESYVWCKAFMKQLIETGEAEKLFPNSKEQVFRLPIEQRSAILQQCKDKGKSICGRQLRDAREQEQVKWMVEEALRARAEKDSKSSSNSVIIGIVSLSVLLIVFSFILYFAYFRNRSKRKPSKQPSRVSNHKSKYSTRSKITSRKGTTKSSVVKRSKHSAKSAVAGASLHKKSPRSKLGTVAVGTITKSKKSNSTVARARSKKSYKNTGKPK